MRHPKHVRKYLRLVGCILLSSAVAGAQAVRQRRPSEPVTRPADRQVDRQEQRRQLPPAAEQSAPPADSQGAVRERVDGITHTAFYADPCIIVTREDLEGILKRGDDDRALVRAGTPQRISDRVDCYYAVQYERRIFPDEPSDNGVRISINFDDKYAKQGQLIIDPVREQRRFFGYPDMEIELEIINGLGDEALYARDKSRFKIEERYKSTAGASPYRIYDNMDALYVRRKEIVLRFQITKIVAGGADSRNVIEIARKALARVP